MQVTVRTPRLIMGPASSFFGSANRRKGPAMRIFDFSAKSTGPYPVEKQKLLYTAGRSDS
jgi:hypothetical protein